jgi:hypothetical protein
MAFRGKVPKRYGQSRTASCPFCGAMAIAKNAEGLSVCMAHKKASQKDERSGLNDIKCKCDSYLELRNGKYGMYFNCLNCGNVKYDDGMVLKNKQDAAKVGTDAEKSGVLGSLNQRKWPAKKKVSSWRSKMLSRKSAGTKKGSGKQEIVISSRDSEWFD